ncbi:MAG: hypothetical protein ACYDEA_08620 [Candidatus Dormibacteria bacterium]
MPADSAPSASIKRPQRGLRLPRSRLGASLRRHWLRVALWACVTVAGLALGWWSFALDVDFTNQYRRGGVLNGWQNLLRQGASWEMLIPVAIAGLLAFIGWLRLEPARPEPTLGLARMEAAPVHVLRASLNQERRVVTAVLEVAFGLVVLACCRFAVYLALALAGNPVARSSLMGVFLEALVWALCGGSFSLWRHRYLAKLESWGVHDR